MIRSKAIVVVGCLLLLSTALVDAQSTAPSPDKTRSAATFEVYKDKAGEYRWRLRVQNTKIPATSGDGFKEKRSCLASIESVKRDVAEAPVKEIEETP